MSFKIVPISNIAIKALEILFSKAFFIKKYIITYRNQTNTIYRLGTGNNFNISSIVGKDNISKYDNNDFLVRLENINSNQNVGGNGNATNAEGVELNNFTGGVVSYNKTTGVVSVSNYSVIAVVHRYYSNGDHHKGTTTLSFSPTVYFLNGVTVQ